MRGVAILYTLRRVGVVVAVRSHAFTICMLKGVRRVLVIFLLNF